MELKTYCPQKGQNHMEFNPFVPKKNKTMGFNPIALRKDKSL